MRDFRVLRYLVWVMTINFWGLCPQTPEVYRLETNPEEVKRWQQVVTLRVAPQQSPNYLWLKDF